jgi:hypothetical protein
LFGRVVIPVRAGARRATACQTGQPIGEELRLMFFNQAMEKVLVI